MITIATLEKPCLIYCVIIYAEMHCYNSPPLQVLADSTDFCLWYEYINEFAGELKMECLPDFYIAGVSSYFSNTFGNNDRMLVTTHFHPHFRIP